MWILDKFACQLKVDTDENTEYSQEQSLVIVHKVNTVCGQMKKIIPFSSNNHTSTTAIRWSEKQIQLA